MTKRLWKKNSASNYMAKDDMTAIEYKGIKVGGGKLLLILPLLGTLSGGLWGGFELYTRLLDAEDKLSSLQPATITAEINRLETVYNIIREELVSDIAGVASDIDAVSRDIDESNRLSRSIESSTAETQREVRNDIYSIERSMQTQFQDMNEELRAMRSDLDDELRTIDERLREMRSDLEERIEQILENPLNDVE
jgi:DNA anti-recombination protein RmuC|tara:strand:- start:875 stop:1459 length:585 start_codon:yes stop_codon:yes gene_type:complete